MRYLVALFVLFLPVSAMAQNCAPSSDILPGLKEHFTPLGAGLTADKKGLVQVYTNSDGEFIIVVNTKEQMTCPIIWGDE